MNPSDPGLRVSIGVSGSGKTHGITSEVESACLTIPVIVIDSMSEWYGDPSNPNALRVPNRLASIAAGARNIGDAIRAVNEGRRLIIVRPGDSHAAIIDAADKAAKWAREYPGVAGLAIPECHHVAPVSGPVPLDIDRIATQWRHHRVAFWADTQRIARLHHSITDNARVLRLYAQWGDLDLKRVREIGGVELVAAINECARKMAPPEEDGDGEPGWHVKLSMRRQPPFKLERF